jgi:protein O-GlcNAc transferase
LWLYFGHSTTLPEDMLAWLKQAFSRNDAPPQASAVTVNGSVDPRALVAKGEADRLADAGDVDLARRRYREAVQLAPEYGEAWNNLGLSLLLAGELDEAESCLRQAVAARPRLAPAWVNLATVQEARGNPDGAIGSLEAALAIEPASIEARNNLGTLFSAQGRLDDAERQFRAVLARHADAGSVAANLAIVLRGLGRVEEALELLRELVDRPDPSLDHVASYLLTLNYSDQCDAAFVAAEHRRLGAAFPRSVTDFARAPEVDAGRPLRVGYVSADFGFHVVSMFAAPVLAAHDPAAVEVFCYFNSTRHDDRSRQVRASVPHWRDIGAMDDALAMATIARDRLDVAVDLSGHTGGNRLALFSRRIAPVQVTWLGYPNTTGVPAMDFRISDAWTDPPEITDGLHTETVVRLPAGFLTYPLRPDAPAASPLPAITRGHVTFGCFNNAAKLSSTCLAQWARVLDAIPEARLLVKARGLDAPGAAARFRARFVAAGGDGTRLDVAGWEDDFDGHLRRYGDVDVAFDSFPYHGTTTTCEALSMGVPVISVMGPAPASRVGASLLSRAGHPEWIATDADDLARIAGVLVSDLNALSHLRQGLRAELARSPLTDVVSFTRALEHAFRRMVAPAAGVSSAS